MTVVMQVTDTAVAYSLKRIVEQVKGEVRRAKRGVADWDSVWVEAGRAELRCEARDLFEDYPWLRANTKATHLYR